MSQTEFKKRLKALMNLPENQVCSDCPERQPRWASLIVPPPGTAPSGGETLPIGAFCCLECSGSHRRLGVHISFVRSITLDSWKEREVLAMENGGNAKVNAIFEAKLTDPSIKPTTSASGPVRERYIRDKYERRKYYDSSVFMNYNQEDHPTRILDTSTTTTTSNRTPASTMGRSVNMANQRNPSDAARLRAQARKQQAMSTNTTTARSTLLSSGATTTTTTTTTTHSTTVDLLDFTTFSDALPPPPSSSSSSFPPTTPTTHTTAITAASTSTKDMMFTNSSSNLDMFSNWNTTTTSSNAQKAGNKMTSDDILKMFDTTPSSSLSSFSQPAISTTTTATATHIPTVAAQGHVQPTSTNNVDPFANFNNFHATFAQNNPILQNTTYSNTSTMASTTTTTHNNNTSSNMTHGMVMSNRQQHTMNSFHMNSMSNIHTHNNTNHIMSNSHGVYNHNIINNNNSMQRMGGAGMKNINTTPNLSLFQNMNQHSAHNSNMYPDDMNQLSPMGGKPSNFQSMGMGNSSMSSSFPNAFEQNNHAFTSWRTVSGPGVGGGGGGSSNAVQQNESFESFGDAMGGSSDRSQNPFASFGSFR